MKYSSLYSFCIVIIVFVFTFLYASYTHATVGGPITIDWVSYNENDKLVYYLLRSDSGRGCPPIIHSMNVEQGTYAPVMDCDAVEEHYYNTTPQQSYYKFLDETFAKYTPLQRIDLYRNDISIEVNYIKDIMFDGFDQKQSAEFIATVMQDNKIKGNITFTGCYKDQPHVFEGYSIPGTNTILLKISRIGNCFEGGYSEDSLYSIQGIELKNTEDLGVWYASGPIVRRGNIVAWAHDASAHQSLGVQKDSQNLVLYILGSLLIGGVLGYVLGKKHIKFNI